MDILLQKQFHIAIICFVAIITSLCYCCTWVLHCISAAEAHTHTHTHLHRIIAKNSDPSYRKPYKSQRAPFKSAALSNSKARV